MNQTLDENLSICDLFCIKWSLNIIYYLFNNMTFIVPAKSHCSGGTYIIPSYILCAFQKWVVKICWYLSYLSYLFIFWWFIFIGVIALLYNLIMCVCAIFSSLLTEFFQMHDICLLYFAIKKIYMYMCKLASSCNVFGHILIFVTAQVVSQFMM